MQKPYQKNETIMDNTGNEIVQKKSIKMEN